MCSYVMLYAHYDMRYIAYAFPEVYAHYAKHEQDIIKFSGVIQKGWSFSGRVPDPHHKLGKLWEFMWKEIERIQSFD